MSSSIYFFFTHTGEVIDLSRETNSIHEIKINFENSPLVRYDDGFHVFLEPSLVDKLDEYKCGDPYGIEMNVDSPFQLARINQTLKILEEILPSKDRKGITILDIGCGQGYITARIKDKYKDCTVSGVDLSISAIKKAHLMFNEIQFLVADANSLPYKDASFDILIFNNIWEHVADPVSMINNAKRVLKIGGHIVISTPSRFRMSILLKKITGRKIELNPHHVTEYTVGQVVEQLQYAGFTVTQVDSSSPGRSVRKFSMKKIIISLLKKLIVAYIRLIGSNHVIGGTVFFIAQKNK